MHSLDLRIGEMLQGEFTPARINVLLAFQVNCPGCFIHALPVAAGLHAHFTQDDVRLLGLSTAFEDFDLNTIDHTRQLLQDGQLVGERRNDLRMHAAWFGHRDQGDIVRIVEEALERSAQASKGGTQAGAA